MPIGTERKPKSKEPNQVFDYKTSPSSWIDALENVLGEALYVLRAEEDSGTVHETASYFLPSGVVNGPSFPDNHVTLNITRPLVGKRLHFRANIRVVEDGKQTLYTYPQVSRMEINSERGSVQFFDVLNGEQPAAELFNSGAVSIYRENPQLV